MQGIFVILEGGDGTGKSSQALRLKGHLCQTGSSPLHIREPGSTSVGEEIRGILLRASEEGAAEITPETEMLLYMACRAQLFRTVIQPALDAGQTVILERSYFSTYAYQGAGLGLDAGLILQLGEWVCGGLVPDRLIVLDLPVAQALSRLGPAKDRIESRDIKFHEKVRTAYLELAEKNPGWVRVVDGCGTPEEVEMRIRESIKDLF